MEQSYLKIKGCLKDWGEQMGVSYYMMSPWKSREGVGGFSLEP